MFNVFWEGYLCLLKIFLFLSICRLSLIYFLDEIHMKKCDKNFLGAFFWTSISFKWYQNTLRQCFMTVGFVEKGLLFPEEGFLLTELTLN